MTLHRLQQSQRARTPLDLRNATLTLLCDGMRPLNDADGGGSVKLMVMAFKGAT